MKEIDEDGSEQTADIQQNGEIESGPSLLEMELGIHRRKRRSVHGRDLTRKISTTSYTVPSISDHRTIAASCLEINEESVIDTIREGCTSVEEMIKKLREQTISLTKKRCIKSQLTPVKQSTTIQLSCMKKLKYKMSISFSKLKLGLRNFLYTFELWYSSMKMIEGKFGSSVATYFKFFRKLFILNCIIFILNLFYIMLPQIIYNQVQESSDFEVMNQSHELHRVNESYELTILTDTSAEESDEDHGVFFFKSYSPKIEDSNLRLGNLFTGMGYLTDSLLFYGHYVNSSLSLSNGYEYDIPSAYFFASAFCYFLVLCVLFFSVAESYKKCYIETSNGIQNVFAEKIFCGWDFGITKADAEELKYCNIYIELKELLNEFERSKKSTSMWDCFYTIMIRMSLNSVLLLLLIGLGWYTSSYLDLHMNKADVPTIMMVLLILTLIATLAPVGFSWLAKIEYYVCPRSALYATLIRTFILHTLIIIMIVAHRLNSSSHISCWETTVGQDIYRLAVLDFIVGVGDNMTAFIRSRMNRKWNAIQRPEFNIARNTMNLIYNQALLYIGLYFSPGLSLIIVFKMLITFYLKKWCAMYNCQPSQRPWRAAQMQTVFLSFAFLVFFGVIITYGYIFASVKTSNCGPFAGGKLTFHAVLYDILKDGINPTVVWLISHLFRPGFFVIILLLMMLAIYYLRSVNSVRRRIVKNLHHIIKEQVSHKKSLLAKINKAEHDLQNATKRDNEVRNACHIVEHFANFIQHQDCDDSGSDTADNSEHIPLKQKPKHFKFEKSKGAGLRNRLCKSSFNLDSCNDDHVKLRVEPSTSLQNLYSLSSSSTNMLNSSSKVFRSSATLSSAVGSYRDISSPARVEVPEVKEEEEEEGEPATDIFQFVNYISENEKEDSGIKDACELTPVVAWEMNHSHRRTYDYDERVPSRIYFPGNKNRNK